MRDPHWKSIILLSLVVPLFFLGFVVLRQKQKDKPINVAMIPAPDLRMKYLPSTIPEEAPEIESPTPEQRRLLEAIERERKALVALETQTYAEKPLIYVAEEYREVPRHWLETEQSSELARLRNSEGAVNALRPLLKPLALKELMEDARFRPLVETVLETLPRELISTIGSDVDEQIGYMVATRPDAVPEGKSARASFVLRELEARTPSIVQVLERKQKLYQVDDAFVSALKVKLAVNSLMGLIDMYLGINAPSALEEGRRNLRRLETQLQMSLQSSVTNQSSATR